MCHRTIIAFWKQKPFWLIRLFTIFGKDSDDEVATEQLTAVVDVTFIPHDNRNILIVWMVTRSINQKITIEQCIRQWLVLGLVTP